MPQIIKGIAASDGIGIAKAYLLIDPDLSFEKKTIDDPTAEYERVEKAFSASIADLATIKQNAKSRLSDEELEVFEAHIAILSDPEMKSQIKDEIESQHVSAEEAMTDVTTNFANVLAAMTDNKYMQERAADVKDVAKRALSHLLGKQLPDIVSISEPVVIIAKEIRRSRHPIPHRWMPSSSRGWQPIWAAGPVTRQSWRGHCGSQPWSVPKTLRARSRAAIWSS